VPSIVRTWDGQVERRRCGVVERVGTGATKTGRAGCTTLPEGISNEALGVWFGFREMMAGGGFTSRVPGGRGGGGACVRSSAAQLVVLPSPLRRVACECVRAEGQGTRASFRSGLLARPCLPWCQLLVLSAWVTGCQGGLAGSAMVLVLWYLSTRKLCKYYLVVLAGDYYYCVRGHAHGWRSRRGPTRQSVNFPNWRPTGVNTTLSA
jgi:hypothetical protein